MELVILLGWNSISFIRAVGCYYYQTTSLAMEFLREKYIPYIVKQVLKKHKPVTEAEFIEFSQALYDQIKQKERELDVLSIKN